MSKVNCQLLSGQGVAILFGILVYNPICSTVLHADDVVSSPPALDFTVPPVTETQFNSIQRIVRAWLECEECTEGQLAAVRSLGISAIPTLMSALNDGPSWLTLVRLKRYLKNSYEEANAHQQATNKPPIAIERDRYVRLHVEGAVLRYQLRAAKGLKAIGGPVAKQSLQNALQMNLPSSVESFIRQSIKDG